MAVTIDFRIMQGMLGGPRLASNIYYVNIFHVQPWLYVRIKNCANRCIILYVALIQSISIQFSIFCLLCENRQNLKTTGTCPAIPIHTARPNVFNYINGLCQICAYRKQERENLKCLIMIKKSLIDWLIKTSQFV